MDETHPWRRLNFFLLRALGTLRGATRTAAEIADHLEAAGFVDYAFSALPDPSPWPASSVAAGAARLLAGATGDGALVESIHKAMEPLDYLHGGPGGTFLEDLRDGLYHLRQTQPRYDEIPVHFGGLEVYDGICGVIEPNGVRVRRAIRELRLAEGHYAYIRQLLGEVPIQSGAIAVAETYARQAHGCIEDALLYISTISTMLNCEPLEVWSFFGDR